MYNIPGLTCSPLVLDSDTELNDYSVECKIGEGATAKVYKGRSGGTPVAIKVFLSTTLNKTLPVPPILLSLAESSDFPPPMVPLRLMTNLEVVANELRLLERLDHPRIIKSLCVLTGAKKICLIMPLLASPLLEPLTSSPMDDIFACEPVPLRVVSKWAHEILSGLYYLHFKIGVSHGDIRHDNICRDQEGSAVLVDFGCHKQNGVLSSGYGSIAYSPPESLHGAFDSLPADIWALGVVLLTALSGRLPYQLTISGAIATTAISAGDPSTTLTERLRAEIAAGRVVFPDSVVVGGPAGTAIRGPTPAEFSQLLKGMLHADPAHRLTAKQAMAQPWWTLAAQAAIS